MQNVKIRQLVKGKKVWVESVIITTVKIGEAALGCNNKMDSGHFQPG